MARFSSRLDWDFTQNRLSRVLAEKTAGGTPILDLTESNPTKVVIGHEDEQILAAAVYEPNPKGARVAREAVAGYYSGRGISVDPERILLTASTSEAYSYLLKLLTDPGDEVLIPQPSYPLFEFLVGLEALETRYYPLQYDEGWGVDLEQLRSSISSRTRALILVNPNNPTGSYLKRGELLQLLELCNKYNLALIADEVFFDYAFAPDGPRVSTAETIGGGLCFTLSGLSKVAGLPQMKLSWIVAGGDESHDALQGLELIADTYLSVSTPVQHATPRLLNLCGGFQTRLMERLRSNLSRLQHATENSPCSLLDVEGGWYAIIRIPPGVDEEELALALLAQDDTLVQPGYFYDFPDDGYLVLSLLPEEDEFAEGVGRLIRRVRQH